MHIIVLAETQDEARRAARKLSPHHPWIYPTTPDSLRDVQVFAVVRIDGWLRSTELSVEALRTLVTISQSAAELETLSRNQAMLASTGVALEQRMLKRERDRRAKRTVQVPPESIGYAVPAKRPWWRRG